MSGPLYLVPQEADQPAGPQGNERTMQLALPWSRRSQARPPAAPDPAPVLSADPLDELAEQLAEVCAAAVHPFEIAAFLEADGVNDQQAALRYGRPDAFTLAEELFAKVPRHYRATAAAPANPWQVSPWRCLVRGLVFALPALGYLLGSGWFDPHYLKFGMPDGAAALAAATVVAWAWNQALAHRTYSWLARGRRRQAGRCLAVGAPVGALLAMAAAWVVGAEWPALWFTAGQCLYMAAATVLLSLGRARHLLYGLAPVAAGAGALALTPLPSTVRAAILLASLAGLLVLAGRALLGCLRAGGEPGRPPALSGQLPQALFGLAAGVLTLLAGNAGLFTGHGGAAGGLGGPAMLSISLSLGLAEWLLYRYRELAVRALHTATRPGEFARRSIRQLAGCLLGYLAALAVLDALIGLLWPGGRAPAALPVLAIVLLGAALWLALLLNAFGLSRTVAAACCLGAGLELSALSAGTAAVTAQLVGCGLVAVLLGAVAAPVLGRVTPHR
ncbi:hypothetical protein [Kitasatospora viridis]|uniref:Uncharacterized protein n=1 Tax=Kitasatospora viridis TaxID=281105 RepID=A0A561TTP7_9ACTN|nr:hypothetical protein [Kitasatospora viridis]TWF90444.1 hypothetical protein FHX73_13491 [Kitasatospora viridis]